MSTTDIHHRLNDELEFFAEHAPLVIKDKTGGLVPFRFNIAQKYIHWRLEAQKREKGWVRAILLKGRQQGGSTYIGARNYHGITRSIGTTAIIISHEAKATDHLLDMVRRFYTNVREAFRPALGKDNPRQLTFPGLSADYSAFTAKNEDAGRSFTAQRVHWSEAAFCDSAYQIQESGLQAIGLLPGTEIIIESTANGPMGFFADKCMAALRGEGDYVLIFVPWYWDDGYEREDDGSLLTEEEEKFVAAHFDKSFPFQSVPITAAKARRKMLWRRAVTFDSSPNNPEVGAAKFRAVYPSNPVEAFLSTGIGEVRASAIIAARANDRKISLDTMMPRIGGLDPAGEGKKADRTILAVRQGHVLEKVYRVARMEPMELVGFAARMIREEKLDKLFVDNGYGRTMVDRLWELGFKKEVIGVWFSEAADNPKLHLNKRSEILLAGADWINAGGVSIPNEPEHQINERTWLCGGDEVHADLASLPMHRENSNGVKSIIAKEEIIKLFGRSPDIFDAFSLTFSYPVKITTQENSWRKANSSDTMGSQNRNNGGLRSLMRKRAMR